MTNSEVSVRPICHGDVPGYWSALDSVAREERFITFTIAPEIGKSAYFVAHNIQVGNPQWVAVIDRQIVGWCDVCRQAGFFSHVGILGVGVIAPYRGQGIGKRLMSAAIADAWAHEFERIELEVFGSNTTAFRLYEKLGFHLEGTRRGAAKLAGGSTDVHLMALSSPRSGEM